MTCLLIAIAVFCLGVCLIAFSNRVPLRAWWGDAVGFAMIFSGVVLMMLGGSFTVLLASCLVVS